MTEIAPHVYLGGDKDAQNVEYLLSEGITYVCVLGQYTEHAHPARLFHNKFSVEDHQGYDLAAHFDDIYDYIDDCLDRGGKVLIHGPTGNGVASAIALLYLMKGEGKTYNKAWYHLRTVYPSANPNSGFVRQLKALETKLANNNPDFGKTRTFPAPPLRNSKNLATMRQTYEYTNNTTTLDKEPANKYTFTRAPPTVHYDVPRNNFTGNATSLAHAP
jgi:serine/threonine/tyrosine-interacting protein